MFKHAVMAVSHRELIPAKDDYDPHNIVHTPEQLMHTITPLLITPQDGSVAEQSAHTLFAGFTWI